MSIAENTSRTEGLRKALQDSRTKLSRQTEAAKATIALIKMLEQAIDDAEQGETPKPPTSSKTVSQHK